MALTKNSFIPPDPIKHITFEFSFDDCWSEDMKAADLLEKYGLRGTFYIIVDAVGKEGHLTWEQIKELDKRGHTIGSHTVTHPSDLKLLYDQDLHYEIQNSKDMLEMVLGHNISEFCYPRGRFDDRVKSFVIRSGYVRARGTGKPGVTQDPDKLALPGTVHFFQRKEYGDLSVKDYAFRTIANVKKNGGYCNLWGHGREITQNNLWDVVEECIKYVAAAE